MRRLILFFLSASLSVASGQSLVKMDSAGVKLQGFYLSMNVENLWISGQHVNWKTGEADKPDATAGIHTHCSAFVAAACDRKGVYILRPPKHGQVLLTNAQSVLVA